MPKHLTCDICGKEPAYEDYDGAILVDRFIGRTVEVRSKL